MNRQRIKVIALAGVLVAGGAYFWAQRSSATAIKPAQTTTAKKPVPGAKPTAPRPSNAKTAGATTPVNAPGALKPTPPPAALPPAASAAKTPAAPVPAAMPKAAPAATPKAAPSVTHNMPAAHAVSTAAASSSPLPAALPATMSWQDQLQKGSYLAEKLRPRLPEGADLLGASGGFRDLQQFVATVAAADNLKLNFDELKRRVLTDRKGLGAAIDGMKKVASATIEEQRAEYEARGLIQEAKLHPTPAPQAPGAKTSATKEQPKKQFRTPSGS